MTSESDGRGGQMDRRCALITGASRGIGSAIAVKLAGEGFDVVVNFARSMEAAERIASACARFGVRSRALAGDISDGASREALLDSVRMEFGRLDVLVNNAGVAPRTRKDILDLDPITFDEIMNVNLRGTFFLTQLAARWMVRQHEIHAEREFYIINITSISSFTSSPDRAGYCISKAGLSMATKLYADRLAQHAIRVYEVRPGIIETDMTRGVRAKYDCLIDEGLLPISRWGTPEDVALAVTALARGYLPYSTGEVVNVDGGFHLRKL